MFYSISESAKKVNVSPATIRNWIKTGYLQLSEAGVLSEESLNSLLTSVDYVKKLSSRANKSRKDSHDHTALSDDILAKLNSTESASEQIGSEYESALSDSFRNKEGIYYTPKEIIDDLFTSLDGDFAGKTFCDPCCGSGNFIMQALEKGFRPENIYGYDTDPIAVAITKKRILDTTGYNSANIIEGDFLKLVSEGKIELFDSIFTNPPWGKKLPLKLKQSYSDIFESGNCTDTSGLFFFACLKQLKTDGFLGLLLPEAFFNIAIFESVRTKAINLNIKRLINYDKPFDGLVTKAQAIVLANTVSVDSSYSVNCESSSGTFTRTSTSFKVNPKFIFNMHCDEKSATVINHIYSLPHVTLKGNAKWGLGIVTGNNEKFCKTDPAEGYLPVYKGADISIKGLKVPSAFIPKDLSLYQQVAPKELYEAPEKLIYKFISSKLCFFHDTERRYILNSANLLIPSLELPIRAKQLCDLLNSNLINWLFQSIFSTHKILRGDLESLPIHADYFKEHSHFNESSYLEYLNLNLSDNSTYFIK
ncbi:MAG: N-6 DNA methylase [Fibrobacteres bacterium]|nr:N-6 DNA methylase [Fibrobacterota bacterium]